MKSSIDEIRDVNNTIERLYHDFYKEYLRAPKILVISDSLYSLINSGKHIFFTGEKRYMNMQVFCTLKKDVIEVY